MQHISEFPACLPKVLDKTGKKIVLFPVLGSRWDIELQVLLFSDKKGNPVKCFFFVFVISQIQLIPTPVFFFFFLMHIQLFFELCLGEAAEVKCYLMCRHGNLGQPQSKWLFSG